jgi:hypothetical protein
VNLVIQLTHPSLREPPANRIPAASNLVVHTDNELTAGKSLKQRDARQPHARRRADEQNQLSTKNYFQLKFSDGKAAKL